MNASRPSRRHPTAACAVIALALTACPPPEEPGSTAPEATPTATAAATPTATATAAAPTPTGAPTPTAAPDGRYLGFDFSDVKVSYDPFSLVVDGKVQLGVVDQVFELSARYTGGGRPASIDYQWTFPGAEEGAVTVVSQEGGALKVSFSEAGRYRVQVKATGRDGESTRAGALIRVFGRDRRFAVGDVDGDGSVTAADGDALRDHLAGISLSGDALDRADVDRDGDITAVDSTLVDSAALAGLGAPSWLSAGSGAAGALITAIHPALLDPAQPVIVSSAIVSGGELDPACLETLEGVPDAGRPAFARGRPGYAALALPIALSCLKERATVEIRLDLGDGGTPVVVGSVFADPTPAADLPPGDALREALARLRMAVEAAEPDVDAYLTAVGAADEERASLLGAWQTGEELLAEAHGQLHVGLSDLMDLDPPTAGALEGMARGQGLGSTLSALRQATAELDAARRAVTELGASDGEALRALLCSLRAVYSLGLDLSAEIRHVAGLMVSNPGFPPLRPEASGPVLEHIARVAGELQAVLSVLDVAARFLPEVGEDLRAAASPALLSVGEGADILADVDVRLRPELCAGAEEAGILSRMRAAFERQVEARAPSGDHAFREQTWLDEQEGAIEARLRAHIDALDPSSPDDADALTGLAGRLCTLFGGGRLPLDPGFLTPDCGRLVGGRWLCEDQCLGEVRLSGRRSLCDSEAEASLVITCEDPDAGTPTQAPGVTCAGNFVLEGSADLAEILPCETVTGSVTVDWADSGALSLPNLRRIERGLTVGGGEGLTGLSIPQLSRVGGGLVITRGDIPLTLPALTTVGDLSLSGIDDAEGAVELPSLLTVEGDLTISGSAGLATLRLAELTAVEGRLDLIGLALTTVELPRLETVGGYLDLSFIGVGDMALPALTTVGGSLSFAANPAATGFSVPALTSVGSELLVTDMAELRAVALPSLERVGLTPPGGVLPKSRFEALPALEQLDLGALAQVGGSVKFTGLGVAELAAPKLAEVEYNLEIVANSALASLDFSLLARASSLTVLQHTGEGLTEINFPALVELRGQLGVNDNANLLFARFPELVETGTNEFVAGIIQVISNPRLLTLDLGSLTTLSGSGASLTVAASEDLADLDLSSLSTLGGCLHLEGIGITELNLPSLTSAPCFRSILNGALTTLVIDNLSEVLDLEVRYNNNLPVIQLKGLTTVSQDLRFEYNQSLVGLKLDSLTTVTNSFIIRHHEALCDVIPINVRGQLTSDPFETSVIDNTGSCF